MSEKGRTSKQLIHQATAKALAIYGIQTHRWRCSVPRICFLRTNREGDEVIIRTVRAGSDADTADVRASPKISRLGTRAKFVDGRE
jgi:hypothetical protein